MLTNAIELVALRKSYGSLTAVRSIDLSIVPGKVNTILGPNGAGKTTTLKAILGLISYTGSITVLGSEIDKCRDRVSFVPEDKSFYDGLTPEQAVKMCSLLLDNFDSARAVDLLENFELPIKKKIATFSHGMRTSMYLSLAMAQNAEIFIFDEPTWGLDPLRRDEVLGMIRKLSLSGKTVLYTSHIIPEVERIADVFSIMYKGEILYTGEAKSLNERFSLFVLPLETELEREKYFVTVEEEKCLKILSNNRAQAEALRKIKGAREETVDLEVFFRLLVRGKRDVL